MSLIKADEAMEGLLTLETQQMALNITNSKVCVCIPSGKDWCADTAMAVSALCALSARYGALGAVSNEKNSLITQARNNLVRRALSISKDITHILWIDSDMTFPSDALMRLLAHDKDIVGAFYNKRVAPYETLGRLLPPPADLSKGGIHRADRMPGGFMLVKSFVYEAMETPWYFESYDETVKCEKTNPDGLIGEDIAFSRKAIEAGFEMWCDMDLTFQMGHIGELNVSCQNPAIQKAA